MPLTASIARMSQWALDLLFPPRCVGCGREGSFLCPACVAGLPRAEAPRCSLCWQPLASGRGPCGGCRQTPPVVDGLRAAFRLEGAVREAVHALKYSQLSALAAPMAALMAPVLAQEIPPADFLAPVPLSPRRQRERGYNQAALLARELAKLCGPPVLTGLVRTRNTSPQARSADAQARHQNVADAFACRKSARGQHFILIDDVTTTGATLNACAGALKKAGASSVWALTFARED